MPQIVTEILLQSNTTSPYSLLTVDGLILTVDGFLQNLGCRRELSGFAGETQQTPKRPKVIATDKGCDAKGLCQQLRKRGISLVLRT